MMQIFKPDRVSELQTFFDHKGRDAAEDDAGLTHVTDTEGGPLCRAASGNLRTVPMLARGRNLYVCGDCLAAAVNLPQGEHSRKIGEAMQRAVRGGP